MSTETQPIAGPGAATLRSMSPTGITKDEHRDIWVEKEKMVSAKLTEIAELRHQILNLCSSTPGYLDVAAKITQLMENLNKLESDLAIIRDQELSHFVGSLDLKHYNLSHSIHHNQVHVVPTITVSSSSEPIYKGKEDTAPPATGTLSPTFGQDDTDSDDDAPLPLRRTMSTAVGTFKQKTPAERWRGLMRMFREWRKFKEEMDRTSDLEHTDAVKAMEVRSRGFFFNISQDERVFLRKTIYNIQQHKNLSRDETIRLRAAQSRLKLLDEQLRPKRQWPQSRSEEYA